MLDVWHPRADVEEDRRSVHRVVAHEHVQGKTTADGRLPKQVESAIAQIFNAALDWHLCATAAVTDATVECRGGRLGIELHLDRGTANNATVAKHVAEVQSGRLLPALARDATELAILLFDACCWRIRLTGRHVQVKRTTGQRGPLLA